VTQNKPRTQLDRWAGDFGNAYINRNPDSDELLRIRLATWAPILRAMIGAPPSSILEVGSNIGANLHALRLLAQAELFALEPNPEARKVLANRGWVAESNILDGSAMKIDLPDGAVDMAFTSGVLIHVSPDDLEQACREIYRVARTYVVCIEYFSEAPRAIPYRGHDDMLFIRDFGGYYMDLFPDLKLLDYGFIWSRATGHDSLTWQVFRKS